MLPKRSDVGDCDFAFCISSWLMWQAEKVAGTDEQDPPLRVHHFKAPSR